MPGIITHNKIFKDSIDFLAKKKKKNYLLRSLATLFNSREYIKAGLFGAIGPNIFDYIPYFHRLKNYGNDISFYYHNEGYQEIIAHFIKRIISYEDKNNEWASIQRSYLYGFISHIIADSIIHPFVFYFSGFPTLSDEKSIKYYREQNLLFQYNIDNYFLYYEKNSKNFDFFIDEMLPVFENKKFSMLHPAIKHFILEAIHDSSHEIFNKIIINRRKQDQISYLDNFGYLDLMPYLIKFTYQIKRSSNKRLLNIIDEIKKRKLFYSDFLVVYPWFKMLNKDALNLHRGRWQYPAGKSGVHYESIDNLMQITVDRIVEVWETIEESLYSNNKSVLSKIMKEFILNPYTGEHDKTYYDLKYSSPVKIL